MMTYTHSSKEHEFLLSVIYISLSCNGIVYSVNKVSFTFNLCLVRDSNPKPPEYGTKMPTILNDNRFSHMIISSNLFNTVEHMFIYVI